VYKLIYTRNFKNLGIIIGAKVGSHILIF